MIVHGGANGGDAGAAMFCRRNGFPEKCYPAQWELHGKRAGPIRNLRMITESKIGVVLAFPGNRGTAHMISIARRAGIEVREISINELNSV